MREPLIIELLLLKQKIQFDSGNQTKNPTFEGRAFCLVDSGRENWNCIFADLITLNERLEQLGINDVSHDSDELKSYSLKNPPTNSTTSLNFAQENLRSSHV